MDADVGSTIPAPGKYSERKAARAVVFDLEGKVALVYSAKNAYHKLPGGGVEVGEDLETAVRRELLEEIGCTVGETKELGVVEEYRNGIGLRQLSYCYTTGVLEKGVAQLDPNEVIEEYVTQWHHPDEAILILEKEMSMDHYQGKFMLLRDLTFLKEARQLTFRK